MCAEVPTKAQAEDVESDHGGQCQHATASYTGSAFVAAVANGGIITFDCGPDPIVIELDATAKIFNDKGPKIVIDGGNKVTLSGKGQHRILYMNTCDQAQKWTTPTCPNRITRS